MESRDRTPLKLHDLPPELLDCIMSFLPPSSVLHLIVNRRMRHVCEQYLYRTVEFVVRQARALHLLKTFVLRPDLAALVTKLYINTTWYRPQKIVSHASPALRQLDGFTALSLAQNLRCLNIAGLDWVLDPSLTRMREAVFQMNLTSLSIRCWDSISNNDPKTSQAVVSNPRAVLRSRPQLESLAITGWRIDAAFANSIETADVPNLRRFDGPISLAKVFLDTALKLTSLHLDLSSEAETSFQRISNGHGVRVLQARGFLKYPSWNSFGTLLTSFPNLESLCILAMDWFDDDHLLSYFDSVSPHY